MPALNPEQRARQQIGEQFAAPAKRGSGVPLLNQEGRSRDGSATFTPEQHAWLGLIRDHIATSLSIGPEDFEYTPFGERGGLGKAHQLFGEQLPTILNELDLKLVA